MTKGRIDIERRNRRLVNTDPQRRCYNGCHFSSELQWTAWEVLDYDVPPEKLEARLKWWRELNDEAVKDRGAEARREFRSVTQ